MTRKKNDPYVTKSMLDEAVEAILKDMDKLFSGLKDGMDKRFDRVETDVVFIKRDIRDIKADLSDTPTKREFNELKTKVETLHSQT